MAEPPRVTSTLMVRDQYILVRKKKGDEKRKERKAEEVRKKELIVCFR